MGRIYVCLVLLVVAGCSSFNKEDQGDDNRAYRIEKVRKAFEPIELGQSYAEIKHRFNAGDPLLMMGIRWADCVVVDLDNMDVTVFFDGPGNMRINDTEKIIRMSVSAPNVEIGGFFIGMGSEELLGALGNKVEWEFEMIADRKAVVCDNGCFFVLSTLPGGSVKKSDTVLSIGVKSSSCQQERNSTPLEGTIPLEDLDEWLLPHEPKK